MRVVDSDICRWERCSPNFDSVVIEVSDESVDFGDGDRLAGGSRSRSRSPRDVAELMNVLRRIAGYDDEVDESLETLRRIADGTFD